MGCVIGGAVANYAVALSCRKAHIIRPPVLRIIAENNKEDPQCLPYHSVLFLI